MDIEQYILIDQFTSLVEWILEAKLQWENKVLICFDSLTSVRSPKKKWMVDNILVNEIVVEDLNERKINAEYVLEDNIHLIKNA